ncbi:Zinc finger CCCH domain-containing protein 37 [Striga hermonthica]|uniref:Zinc finger CCCH domain-containing protein 37 n=1 Tax=Striga hermonthica TaxID=68872 RepID=A0A9N7R865_STRHE|nr:Zinc finger CCCH domain-containing protein 37 [Striga hermonthica]
MANHLYGYSTGGYGSGGGTTSLYTPRSGADSYLSSDTSLLGTSARYLSGDSLSSSSTLSSSLLYNTDSNSARISGLSITTPTQSYGPPGVDAGSAAADSLYAGLKRTSVESLYHQTLLGAHNKIGQTEAWYSANSLSKRPRFESMSHLPVYPQRPGEKDCAYYMQTRTCKFGDTCMFDHPIWVPEGGIPDWKEVLPVPSEDLPERPGQPDCPFFLKTQRCKFGIKCKFNHPKDRIAPPGAMEEGDVSVLPERPSEPPCTFYMKTGKCKYGSTCKFHHPKGVHISSGEGNEVQNKTFGDVKTLQQTFAPALLHNTKGLPIRPGEEDCPFYLKTGSCKYGSTCRYNHPDRYPIAPSLLTSPATHYNFSLVAPAASLLPTVDSGLTQTALGLGLTPTIYPQRPGQIECDVCFAHILFMLCMFKILWDSGAIHCPYYMKTGTCKFGATCKFDHPPPGEVLTGATSQGAASSAMDDGKEDGSG